MDRISAQELKRGPIPQHVAIIMDGNGRWASSRGMPRIFGHRKGVESVRSVVRAAGELGVKVLTLYAFSEENWGRPQKEVTGLISLLDTYIQKEKADLMRNNVQFRTIGNISALPQKTQDLIAQTVEDLKDGSGMILNIALSYSARTEMSRACKEIAQRVQEGTLALDQINQDLISSFLWTSSLPDPDLLIRTSGELRLSNFLLWQSAYAELWFSPLMWPDFKKDEFYRAIIDFQKRNRRFGLVTNIQPSGAAVTGGNLTSELH